MSKNKRIAIVTDTWLPNINGVVRTMCKVRDELCNMGYEVIIVEPTQFTTVFCPTDTEMRLAVFPKRKLRKVLKSVDSIHICTEGPLGISARRYCKKHHIPFTTAFHTKLPEYLVDRIGFPPLKLSYALVRRFHSRSAAVLVPTKSLYKELEGRKFKNLKLWCRGVDTDLFSPQKIHSNLSGPVHLYVGRVSAEKNIEAFLSLDLKGSKIVVGDGPDLKYLKHKYPNVMFTGSLTGENLSYQYARADVFVFPSLTDTFGLVQLEALASGTPVAAFPVPGPIDVITDDVGCLDNDLKKAIKVALTKDRQVCRDFAMNFSWRKCAEEFLAAMRFLQ